VKQDRINTSAADPVAATDPDDNLAASVVQMMEQGVIVWDSDQRCVLFNNRVYRMLEIGVDDLRLGTDRSDFCARAAKRGEMAPDQMAQMESLIRVRQPFALDRQMPSGRVVLMNARPTRDGGYVATFSDVTEARRASRELVDAKRQAEEAQKNAMNVLAMERARQTEAGQLAQLDEWLQSCKSLEELYRVVAKFMVKLLPGSKGELYIYSNSRDVLDGVCNWNTHDLHPSIAPDSCWSLRRGRAYDYDVQGLCFSCDHVDGHHHQVPVDEYICIPIVAHGDTVGLLHIRFESRDPAHARLASHSDFARRAGEHISMAIANAKLRDELRDQSIRDPLTGLYNRRYFMDAIRREVALSDRRGKGFGLISFDADRFKMFNDNHGHDAGDQVLRMIGARMHEVMAADEICCRFGGEEFTILVPGADLAATVARAERLRDSIGQSPVRYLERLLPPVTISCGAACYPTHGVQPIDLLKRADEALYRAKADGRNCVRQAGGEDVGMITGG
jgi:diguanylate cyclase (GGDEF)-like protein